MRRTCLEMVHQLARQDERILFLGSDLGSGTLEAMRQELPHQFFMEGISEQHVIGMAAGLAMEGFIPYLNTIATFLTRRCYEQVAIDLCLHNLPVRLIGSGGGAVYAPLGPTHMAWEDIAIFRALPNMTILLPCDAEEMKRLMAQTVTWPGPIYIRLAKGGDAIVSRGEDPCRIGQGIRLRSGKEVALIACGILVQRALTAADLLQKEGIDCTVINLHTLKPLDEPLLLELAATHRLLVTLEEHSRIGGLGSAVAELLADHPPSHPVRLHRLALPDAFAHGYGSQELLLEQYGLHPAAIAKAVVETWRGLSSSTN